MKKTAIYIFITILSVYLQGCDKIEGNHFETTAATDTSYTFPPDTTADVYRVLLEDYTGHTCGNCPTAARDLYTNIKPTYGDQLITIGVHAAYFAEPCPPHSRPPGSPTGSYSEDFNTTAGTDWYNFFNLSNNPLGLVNRKDYPGNAIKSATSWNTEIASIINMVPQVKIRIHNIYDLSTRQLKTYSETKFLVPHTGACRLNVVLAEDSIVSWQLDDAATPHNVPDYVQRHVLRGSLNGSFGEQVDAASTFNSGAKYKKGYVTTLPETWNAKQVHVIVFLFDDITKEILNVAEAAVME